jgi:aminoglycoside phosphotransferase (APT) family kinase protein
MPAPGLADLVDRAGPVRPGEELDAERLETYLLAELPGARGPLAVEQFPGGFSNLTYLLRLGSEEWVLRRPPFGNRVRTAHDMAREHRVLAALAPVYPPAPRPLLYCGDESVLGAPFYVMERRRGLILHRQTQRRLELPPATARRLSEALIDNLAALHRLDYEAAGLGDLGRPAGYARRQVEGWSERYRRARTDDWPQLEATIAQLGAAIPPAAGAALVHNDYKLDNLVLDPADPTRIVGVLDWEMCTVGDPLMDLGTTLAYWLDPGEASPLAAAGLLAPAWPGSLTRRQLAERYAAATGAGLGDLLFYYRFGLFKLAVIVQQIYARYARGHTRDPRFAHLDRVVGLLGEAAAAAERGGL